MSLLKETKATVGDYDNLVAENYRLNSKTLISGGVFFYTIYGKCTPRGSGIFLITDVFSGQPINTSQVMLLQAFIQCDPQISASGNPNPIMDLVAFSPEYINNPNNSSWEQITCGGSYFLTDFQAGISDQISYEYIWQNYYPPIMGLWVQGGSIDEGTIYVTYKVATM